jgi:ribosomal protein S18 acetylase RimI-like enzyme
MPDLSPVDPVAVPALELRLDPDPDASAQALVRGVTHRRFLGEYADAERAAAAGRAWAERVLPRARLLQVRASADDRERGRVWLVAEGDDLGVLALTLDDHRLAPDVRELVLHLARAEGFRRLTVGVAPGDPALVGFVHGRHFEVAAFQMRLDLDHALPDETTVQLVPMDASTYDAYLAQGVREYAQAREKAGETVERAQEAAQEQMAALLPDGLSTANHHFFVGMVDGERVGTLWLGTERPMAFVYDVVVDEDQRRRGYGAGLMRAGAVWSRARGAHALGLNVFGYNRGAKTLYDRLGFHVVEEFAAHTIGPVP